MGCTGRTRRIIEEMIYNKEELEERNKNRERCSECGWFETFKICNTCYTRYCDYCDDGHSKDGCKYSEIRRGIIKIIEDNNAYGELTTSLSTLADLIIEMIEDVNLKK